MRKGPDVGAALSAVISRRQQDQVQNSVQFIISERWFQVNGEIQLIFQSSTKGIYKINIQNTGLNTNQKPKPQSRLSYQTNYNILDYRG